LNRCADRWFALQLRYAPASAARHIVTAGEIGSRPG
jgi:hypothetical protein